MEEWEDTGPEQDQPPPEVEARAGGMPQHFNLTPNLQDTPTWGNQKPVGEQEPGLAAMWWQEPECSEAEGLGNW